MSGKMLKQNAVRSKIENLKCRKFSTLQKREIKMQRKISVLQYLVFIFFSLCCDVHNTINRAACGSDIIVLHIFSSKSTCKLFYIYCHELMHIITNEIMK